jgi:hypothetical protein
VMLTDANPIPAVIAKANVMSQTPQPTSAVARWPACHSPAAQDGITRATRSAATPTAIKSHPAESVDPSDRANQPFMTMPTAAKARAAVDKRTGATGSGDGLTARNVTVGGALSN